MNLIRRYLRARSPRTCPKCDGRGSDVMDTILRHDFHDRPCSLCGGEGTVRYGRLVALAAARAGSVNHPDDHATRIPEVPDAT